MHHGSCLCGNIQYRYSGPIDEVSRCHCTECQKSSGSAFVAVAPIESQYFEILKGEEFLKEFRATPHKARVFCSACGSPLYSARDDAPETRRLRVGTLDTALKPSHQYQGFVSEKASWYELSDAWPQYERFPG